jgi:radical SAM/Cys-rich protein
MSLPVINDCLRFAERSGVKMVDLTGGAPELNPHLRYFISALALCGSVETVIIRSNLAVLDEPEQEDLPEFLLENNVDVIASLPCYLEENVTAQRGTGVYEKNIRMLQKLNKLGFGVKGPKLHLVYNPGGDFLPGSQQALEEAFKKKLRDEFGIVFNSLYTIANMPIGRFGNYLKKQGRLETYQKLLADNFNAGNLMKVMCRNLISVDWQGRVYDCDFNHALHLPIEVPGNYIGNMSVGELVGEPIIFGQHCFTCTAGAGTSCQGSLSTP